MQPKEGCYYSNTNSHKNYYGAFLENQFNYNFIKRQKLNYCKIKKFRILISLKVHMNLIARVNKKKQREMPGLP